MLIHRLWRGHAACWALLLALAAPMAQAATAPTPQPAPAQKDPTIYHLEIVLFRNTNPPSTISKETWPDIFGTASVEHLIYPTFPDLAPATPPPPNAAPGQKKSPEKAPPPPSQQYYRFLGQRDFKLSATVAKLARLPGYEVMLHTAWRQPAIDLQDNSAVYLFDGMMFPEHPLEGGFSPNGAATPVGAMPESPVFNPPRFSGTVKLAAGRYLHVDLDVLLRGLTQRDESVDANGNLIASAHTGIQGYRLDETRRIKIGEVHYFDHPAFGALVLVAATEKSRNTNVEKETVGDSPILSTPPDD